MGIKHSEGSERCGTALRMVFEGSEGCGAALRMVSEGSEMVRRGSPHGFRGVGNGAEQLPAWFPRGRKWRGTALRMISDPSEGFLIAISEVFHELHALVHRRVSHVRIAQAAPELVEALEIHLVHPFLHAHQYLRDDFSSVRVNGAAHLRRGSTGEDAFHDIFPIVDTGGRGDADARNLARNDRRPANRVAEVGMMAENLSGNELHRVDVDVRLVKTIEEDDAVGAVGFQDVYEGRNVAEVFPDFDDDRDGDRLLDLAQETDVEVMHVLAAVGQIGFQEENIQFQGIGAGQLDLPGEVNPRVRLVAIHAGDDGDGAQRLCLFDNFQIVIHLMSPGVSADIIFRLRIKLILHQLVALNLDLLLEERFQHDGARASFFKLLVAFRVDSQSGASYDNRVTESKPSVFCL